MSDPIETLAEGLTELQVALDDIASRIAQVEGERQVYELARNVQHYPAEMRAALEHVRTLLDAARGMLDGGGRIYFGEGELPVTYHYRLQEALRPFGEPLQPPTDSPQTNQEGEA